MSITRIGDESVPIFALTKNISSGGVLFTSEREPDVGISIEYFITLGPPQQSLTLHCDGHVVRCQKASGWEQSAYEVAASMERYRFVRPEGASSP